MKIDRGLITTTYKGLAPRTRSMLNQAVKAIVDAKKQGGKVATVVGSGPNLHEGVTTLIS